MGSECRLCLPLLDFVETGEERDRDEDDDSLFAVANFELLGRENDNVSALRSPEEERKL